MEVPPCRVCFSRNVRMHDVINTPLQDIYEKLINSNVRYGSGDRYAVCFLCYAQLQRCYSFQQSAARAAHLLEHCLARLDGAQDTLFIDQSPLHNYVTTPVAHFTVNATEREEIKEENETEFLSRQSPRELEDSQEEEDYSELPQDSPQMDLKMEFKSEHPGSNRNDENHRQDSDTDDDIPLNKITKTPKRKRGRHKSEGDKTTKKSKKLMNVTEIILTDEQQRLAMVARRQTRNYRESRHPCELCGRGFTNHLTYCNHMETHAESRGSHVCSLCSMRYRTPNRLNAHILSSHARQFVCDKCGHTSNTKHAAEDHQRLHTGNHHKCKLCGKMFNARSSYLTHVRAAHARAAHACVTCGERCVSALGLRMHRARAHRTATSNNVCAMCGERFASEFAAQAHRDRPGSGCQHMVEETSSDRDRRYCAECGVQFLSLSGYATHVLSTPAHRDSDANECPICKQTVEKMSVHMKQHDKEMRKHEKPDVGEPKFDCDQCESRFASRARLAAHARRVHLGIKYDKRLVCELCGKNCSSAATLRYHQRTHSGERPHACSACGKRFADSNQLRIHARAHSGERPYACQRCGKRFAQKPALNRHARVHTGAKPFTCELCSKSFSQSNSLHGHVRAVHLKMAPKKRARVGAKKQETKTAGTDVKTDLAEIM